MKMQKLEKAIDRIETLARLEGDRNTKARALGALLSACSCVCSPQDLDAMVEVLDAYALRVLDRAVHEPRGGTR